MSFIARYFARSGSNRPKTFAVLQYLVERPGKLVRNEALPDPVWADGKVLFATGDVGIGTTSVRRAFISGTRVVSLSPAGNTETYLDQGSSSNSLANAITSGLVVTDYSTQPRTLRAMDQRGSRGLVSLPKIQ